jgi:hypothetical protein
LKTFNQVPKKFHLQLPNLEDHEAEVLALTPPLCCPTHEIIIPLTNNWKTIANSLIV